MVNWAGQFVLSLDGVEVGAFSEVSGLSVEVKVETIDEGGQNEFSHKVPGRMQWPNLVLKAGVTSNSALFDWFRRSSGAGLEQDYLQRTTVGLALIDGQGEIVRAWELDGAFPVKWSGPQFAAGSREVAMETLEIAHHGLLAEEE